MARFTLPTLMVFGFCAGTFADTHLFECKLKEKGHSVTVRFGVAPSLDPKEARLVEVKGSTEYEPIVIEPKRINGDQPTIGTLNGQGGDLRMAKSALTLFGDDDGVQYAWLVLYKNSNYTKGYAKFEGPRGKDNWYQRIRCTHNVD